MLKLTTFGFVLGLFFQNAALAEESRSAARIGVLAYRGSDQLQLRWLTLRDYLGSEIPEWSFEIVPITLSSAAGQIESGQLDFIVTNPGHFVDLNRSYRLSVIATRSQQKSDGTFSGEFGSAIIALKDSEIKGLRDVAGKSVAAIDINAFGGFQMAWHEFDRVGLDLFEDPKELRFVGFPMDQVVMQVLDGTVDVGIVRSGLLEDLAREGKIDPSAFIHLNANVTYSHSDRVSTGLYPEWPFAVLATTDSTLSNRVALALLKTNEAPDAELRNLLDGWSAPAAYHSAFELKDAFQKKIGQIGTAEGHQTRFAFWAFFAATFLIAGAFWRNARAKALPAQAGETALEKTKAAGVTPRERQVLVLVAEGNSTKEIAIELGISPKTVEFHRSNLLRKFDAKTSSQLVALAT
jgi:two-component system sensor histidine kinase TtrS